MENKKDKHGKALLLSFLVAALTIGALVGVTMIDTQNINYYNDVWAKNTIYTASMDIAQPTSKNPVMQHEVLRQFGAATNNAAQAKNGSAYISNITQKLYILLGIIGGILIAILWVKVAINFFSDDPQRKAQAKEDAMKALLGTILIAMAVFGAVWAIAGWMVGATGIILPNSLLVWAL